MMNYTVDGNNHIANEGYVFVSKITGIMAKEIRFARPEFIDNYDVVPEPIVEETETTETN